MGESVNPDVTVFQKSEVPAATPVAERADLRPENIQDAVIRLAGNSQDGRRVAH